MFSIGLYTLLQTLFYWSKGSALMDSVALKAINSFIEFDPTEKIRGYLINSVVITEDEYNAKKSVVVQKQSDLTWKQWTGSLMYVSAAMILAAISILYHFFGEKRETVSRLAELAITATIFVFVLVELYLYFNIFKKFVFVHSSEIVKTTLAEVKKSLSSQLVAFWNDNKNQDMRDQLRKKADLSDGIVMLIKRLEALLQETSALSSVHEHWSKDLIGSFEGQLTQLETSLRNTRNELVELIDAPSKPEAMLANQSKNRSNLATLNALSNSVSGLSAIRTDTPDVDILLQSITGETQGLVADLESFSKIDLFASYRSTRDVLVALSKQCASENDVVPVASFKSKLVNNLNTLAVSGLAAYIFILTCNSIIAQNKYRVSFCYLVVTCIGLLMFQPYFLDYMQEFNTISGDLQIMLFSALNA